jgi:transposase
MAHFRLKKGVEAGKTKKGKGTKLMLLTEAHGILISDLTTLAQVAKVHTIETLVDLRVAKRLPKRMIYDKAADADWIRDSLSWRGIEQITPHRKARKKPPRQDGRSLRRYLHRWKIERTTSWLQYPRRLLVRHERHTRLLEGFFHLACICSAGRGFGMASTASS